MKRRRFSAALLFMLMLACPVYAANIYDSEPTFSPYYAGVVRHDVLEKTLEELNYIRGLIGVPNNVTLDDEFTNKAQHGAVLLDAIGRLDHTPNKPYDMTESFYELGYAGTSSSNLAWGTSLQDSIALYMYDSDSGNISALGHRRWLMNPKMRQTGFGMSVRGMYSATYVFQRGGSLRDFVEGVLGKTYNEEQQVVVLNQEEEELYTRWNEEQKQWPVQAEFISWPTGKNPHPLYYFAGDAAWSVILNRNIYASFNDTGTNGVVVMLTRKSDGRQWSFTSSNSDGYFNIDTSGYGDGECVIFRPSDVDSYNDGEVWNVKISGLVRISGDIPQDSLSSLSFDVTFTEELTGYESDAYLDELRRRKQGTESPSYDNNTPNNDSTEQETSQDNNTPNNDSTEQETSQDNSTPNNDSTEQEDNVNTTPNNDTRQDVPREPQESPERNEPPRNDREEDSGSGGCNTMPMTVVAALIILGIPRAGKYMRVGR